MGIKNPLATKQQINAINTYNRETDRLSIKKFTLLDVQKHIEHEMDPELMRYIRVPLPLAETQQRTMDSVGKWTGEDREWVLLSIYEKHSNNYLGVLSFRYESINNETAEIGWRIGSNDQGKGYATEAAKNLLDFIKNEIKAHKVVAYCVVDNTASSNIMKKLGMQKEGHLRQFCQLDGVWHDEAIYGFIIN